MSTIRVGVAGLGYWGPNLARNFAAIADCDVVWLCDGDPAALERAGRIVPTARRTGELRDLLADGRARRHRARHAGADARRARRARPAGRQALLRREAARPDGRRRRARRRRRRGDRPDADGRPPARVPPGRREAQGDRRRRRARRHPLHLLQPAQPREAARGRERALVARRARRLRAPAPGGRGAVRDPGARRVLHAPGDRGRRVRLPALPVRPRRAPAPLLAGPAQGAALHGRRLAPDGDVRRHGPGAQGHRLRQGLRPADRFLGRVHHAVRRHLEPGDRRTASRCGSSASTS